MMARKKASVVAGVEATLHYLAVERFAACCNVVNGPMYRLYPMRIKLEH
jgi:hypothetical protein